MGNIVNASAAAHRRFVRYLPLDPVSNPGKRPVSSFLTYPGDPDVPLKETRP